MTTASVDGRVTLSADERLLAPAVHARWSAAWPPDVEPLLEQRRRWVETAHAPTVTLEGSGTFVGADAVSPWAASGTAEEGSRLLHDHLPRTAPRWFAVVDGRGRVGWDRTGEGETALVVLVCRATPRGYLERLREIGAAYLVAGGDRVDLHLALERLGTVLGASAVAAAGGGGINGALLRAGLVDEVHVVTVPVLVGGAGTPSLADGPALHPGDPPVALRSLGVTVGDHGTTWSRFEVVAPAAPSPGTP